MPVLPIRYTVAMPEPESHEFHVEMEIPPLPARSSIDIVFPVWAPGSYLVRDFSRNIYDLTIRDADSGRAIPWQRIDKTRWRVKSSGRAVSVRYRVFAFEVSVRTSFLDASRAFLSGSSLFFFVDGEVARPCLLSIGPRTGWTVSTVLPAVRGKDNLFRATSYDELIDAPVEVGTHEHHAFRVGATRFEVTLQGRSNIDRSRMLSMLRAIVRATSAMFGGFPFDRYLFIIHALPNRGGGLEHACSTTLDIAGFSFEDEKGYQSFAALAAHEFFHAWNVKRIADRVLGPFDYTKENYTDLLWFHEGFTEYAQGLVLLRAGLLTVERYLKDLAEDWSRYCVRPGRNVSALSQLSYEAWIKQYRPAENHVNRMVSYYDKGRWAGLVLDLQMRLATDGRRGVPDLFRRLWSRHGATGRGIDAGIIRAEAEAIVGRSLHSYFARFIDGIAELPVPALLRQIGISVSAIPPAQHERNDATKAARLRAWSGLAFANGGYQAAVVKNVVPDSPAWRAGVTFGDELVAVDGTRVDATTVSKRLADAVPGQQVTVSYFRKDELREASFRMAKNPERRWCFTSDRGGTGPYRRVIGRWLGVEGLSD